MQKIKYKNQSNNYDATQCFTLGQKVIAKKLGWGGNGSVYAPFHRVDVLGKITSIKGMPNHIGSYKYEFSWKGGKMMTDGIPHNNAEMIGMLVNYK